MYLAPYKIFTISKNKRLLKPSEPHRTIGIYDVEKFNYENACIQADKLDAQVSILLGEVYKGVNLICLDLDDCYDEHAEMEELTKEFLKEFNDNEWEISTSGTGIHIYILTRLNLDTFIVKDMEGSKSFECYTNKRHIVTTLFDFENTSLAVGKHDAFLEGLYSKVRAQKTRNQDSSFSETVRQVFDGTINPTEQEINGKIYKRTPVTDMYTLRGLGYKDPMIIEVIDESPDAVDQSAHDAKLIRKLMYYTLSFEAAWELAQKTNYYKAKDERHKKKFNDPKYIERTRKFIGGGYG